MILRAGGRPYGLAGIGDAAPARKTLQQLAAELKAVLDQVGTVDEAKAVGLKAYQQLQALLERIGVGYTASGLRDYMQPSLDGLQAALVRMPLFDGPVGDEWFAVPDGLRRKIQAAAGAIWALEVPEGTNLDREDLANFAEGFSDTLQAELRTIGRGLSKLVGGALEGVGEGLGVPWWVVAGGAGLVVTWALLGDRIRRALS